MNTLDWFGKPFPILQKLSNGYYLVALDGGPAICNGNILSVLYPEHEGSMVERSIRREAMEAYIQLTWPAIYSNINATNP